MKPTMSSSQVIILPRILSFKTIMQKNKAIQNTTIIHAYMRLEESSVVFGNLLKLLIRHKIDKVEDLQCIKVNE